MLPLLSPLPVLLPLLLLFEVFPPFVDEPPLLPELLPEEPPVVPNPPFEEPPELPEPLSGQVFHAGLYPAAAAVADRAPPQGAGIQSNGSAAVAAAFPDGVSVLSLLRGRLNRKLPDAKPNADARMRRAAHLPHRVTGDICNLIFPICR